MDGFGRVQNIVVLGGTSQIGQATANVLLTGPGTIVLAGRDQDGLTAAATALTQPHRTVQTARYDATGPAHSAVDCLHGIARSIGDLDVIVVCVGALRHQETLDLDPAATEESLRTNMLGPALAAHAAAVLLASQGHGTVVVLSSVAALRPRRELFTYAAAKAGLDAYARGLAEMVRGSGATVLVVRPGQVRTRMTKDLSEPPFTVDPNQVAYRIRAGLRADARVIYVPASLRLVMAIAQILPGPLHRRLTARRWRQTSLGQ